MNKNVIHTAAAVMAAVIVLAFTSCNHDSASPVNSVKKWEAIEINAANEVPAPAGRSDEGELTLELNSDNSLTYNFHLHNLAPSDMLTGAHIHFGDAGTSGPIIIDLHPVFSGAASAGMVTNLRQGQIDTLLNMPVYFNVHSAQVGAGIARAQLDKEIEFAADIPLSGDNEAPNPVASTATGNCILRLTDDHTLYYRVTVTGLEGNDTLTASHIHRGAMGINGPVRIPLAGSEADFGVLKNIVLADSLVQMLRNDPVYVNVHSKLHGAGLLRGQIR